jgi:hypothetical protein
MFTIKFTSYNFNRVLKRFFSGSILATVGIFSGLVSQVSPYFPTLPLIAYAYAQDYTQDEVLNYAKAGFAVELLRQQVYQEIKAMINEPPPNIVCNQPETFQSLSKNIRQIAIRYCNDSMRIVRNNNLTVNRFNELKQVYDRGGDFYQEVQNKLIELQNQQR